MLASSRYWNGRFHNTARVRPGLEGPPLPLLGEWFFGDAERIPRRPLPLVSPLASWARPAETGLRVTWLGHSTVLLEMGGVRVLTDPVFGERAAPLRFAGPRRFHAVPALLRELPPLDLVLLSHDHYDHLCRDTIEELARGPVPFVTSLGVGAHLERLGVGPERIHELEWWETTTLAGGRLAVTATPAQHFSGRGLSDRNATAWSSFCLEGGGRRVFFSGDTGLTEEFREIGARRGPFDLVMLEIGAYHPAWGKIHLGPENALTAFDWLGGGTLLPVHWSTFSLALHAWDQPADHLIELAGKSGQRVVTPRLGAVTELERVAGPDAWWRG
ncbi:MAG: MBL fold metallo-hydrolase [Deltaproteobacteria bacterium]|nr:MBL fold metallo-hydrolase [Deltaproteobacteria bacterium]